MAISGVAFDSDHLAGPVYSGKTGSHSQLIYWVFRSADEQSFFQSRFSDKMPTVPYCEVVIPLKDLTVPEGFCLTQRMYNMVTKEIVIGFPRHILDTTLLNPITATTTIQAQVEIGVVRFFEFEDRLDADFGTIYAECVSNKLWIGSGNIPFESSGVFSVFARNLCRNPDCMPTTFQKHVEANIARLLEL
jgi:hypothetical protein